MLSQKFKFFGSVAALGLALQLAPTVQAQSATATPPASGKTEKKTELPSVSEILNANVKALGGKEKLASVKSITSRGVLSIPAAGVKGEILMQQTAEGKFLMNVDIPGVANSKSGSDGKTIWESSSVTGPEVLKGPRAEQSKLQMKLFPALNMGEFFDSMECTGKETFKGEECYVVVFKNKDSAPMTTYYSVKTGLEKGNKINAITSMGELNIVTEIKSHMEKNGIQFSKEVEASLPNGMTQLILMDQVELDATIDAKTFDLPKEVADLVK